MRLETFNLTHLEKIKLQRNQKSWLKLLSPEDREHLANSEAYTVIDDDGKVLAIGGVQEIWHNRGVAWSYIAADLGPKMLAVHRIVKKGIALWPQKRIELYVETGFSQGHRWAKMLGFKRETQVMEKGLPNGKDCSVYVRIQ